MQDAFANTPHIKFAIRIATLALILRVLVALIAYWSAQPALVLWPSRGVELFGIARSLALGQGYSSPFAVTTGPTAFVAPIYPALLAGVFKIFGIATRGAAWAMILMQSVFAAATCIPIYALGSRCFGPLIGKRAAWGWALFPYAVVLPGNFIWDTCFSAFLLCYGMLLLTMVAGSDRYSRWSVTGAYWAGASLTNASLLLILPSFVIWLLWARRDARPVVWKPVLLGLLVFFLCLLPWSIRNRLELKTWLPIRSNFALELWIGNHFGVVPGYNPQLHPAFNPGELSRFVALGEIGYMTEKRNEALEFIKKDFSGFLRSTGSRFVSFWTGAYRGPYLRSLIILLVILGWAGAWLTIGNSRFTSFFIVPLIIYPLPFYITHPDLRYQHPIQPILMILAVYAVSRSATALRHLDTEP